MNDLAVSSAGSMIKGANDIQSSSVMKLINSGAQSTASAAPQGGNSALRTDAMNSQGVGNNLDVSC